MVCNHIGELRAFTAPTSHILEALAGDQDSLVSSCFAL